MRLPHQAHWRTSGRITVVGWSSACAEVPRTSAVSALASRTSIVSSIPRAQDQGRTCRTSGSSPIWDASRSAASSTSGEDPTRTRVRPRCRRARARGFRRTLVPVGTSLSCGSVHPRPPPSPAGGGAASTPAVPPRLRSPGDGSSAVGGALLRAISPRRSDSHRRPLPGLAFRRFTSCGRPRPTRVERAVAIVAAESVAEPEVIRVSAG